MIGSIAAARRRSPAITAPTTIHGLVADGDSITQGHLQYPHYPDLVMATAGVPVVNIGVSGRQLQTMDSGYSTATAPSYGATSTNTIVILGGVNDIRSAAATDTNLKTWIQSYCGKAIATGFNVYVGTILPCSSSWDSTKEGYRSAYNAWLLANYASFCHGVIDFAGNSLLDDSTDTAYYSDGLHPTYLGLEAMRDQVISSLGLSTLTRDNAMLLFPAEQTITAATLTNIPMSGRLLDNLGIWSRSSPDSLTIPSGLNGRYGRIIGGQRANTGEQLVGSFTKGGATFIGSVPAEDTMSSGFTAVNPKAPPVPLATGDVFRMRTFGGTTGSFDLPNDEYNWLGFELLPSTYSGALVTHTTTQALVANTAKFLSWNSEAYDLNSFHSTTVNTTRLLAPSGVSRVRISAGIQQPFSAAVLTVEIYKNGAKFRGMAASNTDTSGSDGITVASAVVPVTGGTDYFEIRVTSTLAQTLAGDTQWACIEAVPATRSAVLLRLGSSQVISALTSTDVNFDTAVYDDASWYSSGSPNQITVPSGVYRVRLSGNLIGGTSNFGALFRKNGLAVHGTPNRDTEGGTEATNIMSAIIPVVPGDVITMVCFDNSGCTLSTDEGNWMCAEAMDALAG